MRVDDWDEDSGEAQGEVVSTPVAAAPAVVAAVPVAEGESAADATPAARPKPPLSAVLPIYLIGIVSISLICLMFAIIMALIITR